MKLGVIVSLCVSVNLCESKYGCEPESLTGFGCESVNGCKSGCSLGVNL